MKVMIIFFLIKLMGEELPEWLKGADCKSVSYAYAGSNPAGLSNS